MNINMIISPYGRGSRRKAPTLFTLFFILSFFVSPLTALAAESRTTLKFVFPFGDPKSQSICPLPQRTLQGCCSETKNVYDYSGKKACCSNPNELLTYGQEKACCTPWKTGQNRWGQTTSSVCGGYCPPTSRIVSTGGYSSCCTDCALVDGIRAFETAPGNVCGTCCSRIPESCGNAGVRVCSPGTGSAYCSKLPDKCNDQDDWLIGSHGEGGYTCCDKCTNGKRYNQTNSGCGSCCTNPNVTITYQGTTSCCTSWVDRIGQTPENICGINCTSDRFVTYGTSSSCCTSLSSCHVRWGQTATSVCGQTCPAQLRFNICR